MPETVRIIRVFVSSPGDVQAERDVLDEVVASINRGDGQAHGVRLELFKWEENVTPQIGPKPQQVVDHQTPEILGEYIGAALIGTLTGIFWSYAVVSPVAQLIKTTREKQMENYIIVKQTIIAFMNGALPQIALEHGRKTISSGERPTIDEVENAAITSTPAPMAQKQAA